MCAGPVYGTRHKSLGRNHPSDGDVPAQGGGGLTLAALPEDELAVGETYASWRCAACESVIPVALRAPDSGPFDLPDAVIYVTCLQCEAVRFYHVHQRRERRYPWSGNPPS
jgi:hypothetical protein